MPFVDVIVPTFQRFRELVQCLESVQSQTFTDWQCWIAEDGKTDETYCAVRSFLQDQRFHYLPGPHVGRPAVPRNRAIRDGTAPYVAFLDDYDLWLPEKLEMQLEFLRRHPECVLLGSNAYRWPGETVWSRSLPLFHPSLPFRFIPYEELLRTNFLINSSVICSRQALNEAGLVDERPILAYEDYNLWLRIGALGEIWLMEDPLVVYRDNPFSSIRRSGRSDEKMHYRAMAAVFQGAKDGVEGTPSPLSLPENESKMIACRKERDRYQKLARRSGLLSLVVPYGNSIFRLLIKLLQRIGGIVLRNTLDHIVSVYLRIRNLDIGDINDLEALKWERNALVSLQVARTQLVPENTVQGVESVVFSKDRALQLHALLSSLQEKTSVPIRLHILYFASTKRHQLAYDDVIQIFEEKDVSFLRQKNTRSFREDLISLLERISSQRIFFLVDDIVFTRAFDPMDFCRFDTDRYVPSLRMGLNLRRCYTKQADMPAPEWSCGQEKDKDKTFWFWKDGILDWNYPLSVDGHFFATWEILEMAKKLPFKAPNSFEETLQRFRPIFLSRRGVAYTRSRLVNIACNKVQDENQNICGKMHQDFLLEKWEEGLQMDYRSLDGFINESSQQEVLFGFVKRGIYP